MRKDPDNQLMFIGLGGWDTHVNQGDKEGQLARKFLSLGQALSAFVKGLGKTYQDTVIVVLSEFGRTVRENGNRGTDHGYGNIAWVLGGGVRGGRFYGRWSGLEEENLFEGRDLQVTTDYRSLLGLIARRHLGVAGLDRLFPGFSPESRGLEGLF